MLYLRKTFSYEYPLEEAQACLIGIPWDSTETGLPVRFGPLFIREAIKGLPGRDPLTGLNPFEKLKLTDLGDVEVVPGDWDLTRQAIEDTVKSVLEAKPEIFPVFLGGEHLITLAIIERIAELKGSLSVVHLDAHRDLMPDWMGNPHSHITWAHHAVSNKKIKLIQLGIRSWDKQEEYSISGVDETLEGLKGPVYLTLDLDVFDPSHAPEVGTPEPNGMRPEEFFGILEQVCGMELAGMDIVECASQRLGTRTALLAAQVFKKTLAYQIKGGRWK
jgi:agmatinase